MNIEIPTRREIDKIWFAGLKRAEKEYTSGNTPNIHGSVIEVPRWVLDQLGPYFCQDAIQAFNQGVDDYIEYAGANHG